VVPGVGATVIGQVPPYFDLFTFLAEQSPLILLDQRGTGLSTPAVGCSAGFRPPPNLFVSPQLLQRTYVDAYSKCTQHWESQGISADDFTVEDAADDIEDLRAALGVPQVDLLALSFGTRIALEVIRRHPDRVRRAVLQGTVTPDGLVRLPLEMDSFFRRTAADAEGQAAAEGLDKDLEAAYRNCIRNLKRTPLAVPIKTAAGTDLTVNMGAATFAALVATRPSDSLLPALLTSVSRGDPV
jgi:pimeloyl-ACP methyl ester carboxylesterase